MTAYESLKKNAFQPTFSVVTKWWFK